jgi:hypothetical protein
MAAMIDTHLNHSPSSVRRSTDGPYFDRIALAALLGSISGLLMARAGAVGLDHALPFWLAVVLLSGIILEPTSKGKVGRALGIGFAWAFTPVMGAAGYILLRYLASGVLGFPFGAITMSGVRLGPERVHEALPLLIVIGVLLYVASAITVILAAACGRLLVRGATAAFEAGPDPIERARKLVLALASLFAALFVLWSAIS